MAYCFSAIGMIEVLRQVNAKDKARYFALVEDERHPISKCLYDHLGTMAERTDTIHTTQQWGQAAPYFFTFSP
ncbi:hypothetical protein [Acinetobacter indicus]|uniref:hypothetical protein n=1 Tax=Acinetobacter indicus TaxID=756892 RepID=UPI0013D7E988|nr:hypothetical protein [Acinetobacter indicus]